LLEDYGDTDEDFKKKVFDCVEKLDSDHEDTQDLEVGKNEVQL
jgi:hypothetical protein